MANLREECCLKEGKDMLIAGSVAVTSDSATFTSAAGQPERAITVVFGTMRARPTPTKPGSKNVLLKVPGAEGDILLDFTQLSGDGGPVARRDAVLAAIIAQLSTGAHAGGGSGVSADFKPQAASKAQPLAPPTKPKAPSRPSETAAPAASKPVEGADKGRPGGGEVEQQRALKLMTNKRLSNLRQELVVEMGIQTEAEFWSTIEGPAGSVGPGASSGQQLPVPSTIPSMSDVVRTNTEVKVKLDAAQVHKLRLDYPLLKPAEDKHVHQGNMTLEQFWTGFFDFVTNGPECVSEATRKIFGPVVDSGGANEDGGMTRAEKKQRIATVDATVNLTRFLELPKYLGCGGRGFPSGPSPRRLLALQKSLAGGGSKAGGGALMVSRVNRHQLSVLETVEASERGRGVPVWRSRGADEGGGGLARLGTSKAAKLKVKRVGLLSGIEGGEKSVVQGGSGGGQNCGDGQGVMKGWKLNPGARKPGDMARVSADFSRFCDGCVEEGPSSTTEGEVQDADDRLFVLKGLLKVFWGLSASRGVRSIASGDKTKLPILVAKLDRLEQEIDQKSRQLETRIAASEPALPNGSREAQVLSLLKHMGELLAFARSERDLSPGAVAGTT